MARPYENLTEFLRGESAPEVVLSFGELDRLVGGLPASARKWPAWWANNRASQPHAWCWLDAGRRAAPDLNAEIVRFAVAAETEHSPRGGQSRTGVSAGARKSVRLIATGETEEADIFFEWSLAGQAEIDADGRLAFPRMPSAPGVYRFTLYASGDHLEAVYLGESSDLERRMTGYRKPSPTQQTNQRINARLTAHLVDGGDVEVAVSMAIVLNQQRLDLGLKASRLLGESLAVVQAHRGGVPVENL